MVWARIQSRAAAEAAPRPGSPDAAAAATPPLSTSASSVWAQITAVNSGFRHQNRGHKHVAMIAGA